MKGYRSMIGHQNRPLALGLIAGGLVVAVAEKTHPFTILPDHTRNQHIGLALCITIYGMMLLAMTKEKIEDERVKAIRAQAMQFTVLMFVITQLTTAFMNLLNPADGATIGSKWIILNLLVNLTVYHIFFRIGLYRDKYWNYQSDDISLKDAWFKNKWLSIFAIAFFLLALILLIVLD